MVINPHPKEVAEAVSQAVSDAVRVAGIPTKQLAEQTGIARPTLARSLAGHRSWTVEEVARIAQAINVPPSTLLVPTVGAA